MLHALAAGASSKRLGFDPRPEQAIAAVVDGYDDEADYLPAVVRPALPPAPDDDDLDEIGARAAPICRHSFPLLRSRATTAAGRRHGRMTISA